MGLRERNAAQTRELILETALPLFLTQGYDATTMEEVAEAAQIGTSTLYRYFPTKDLLVLEPLSLGGHMADELRRRPAEEPLDVALGHAVTALLTAPRGTSSRLQQVQAILDSSPALGARLLEEFIKERTLLEQAVAERCGRPDDDVFSVVTARLATVVLELAAERSRVLTTDDPDLTAAAVLTRTREVSAHLHAEPPVLPRIQG